MKTTLIIGIALVIALFAFVFGGVESTYTGFLAAAIVAFQGYAGYYFEGKKSFVYALAGPVLLGFFIAVAKVPHVSFIVIMAWLGLTIYLGYKAEIDES